MAALWRMGDGRQAFRTCICRYCQHTALCEQATCHRHFCLVFSFRLPKEDA